MTKRILTVILSAFLVVTASACNDMSDDKSADGESTFFESKVESDPIIEAEAQIVSTGSIPRNGNDNDRMIYEVNQYGNITLQIEEWNENHLVVEVPLSSDTEIEMFRHVEKAIAINDEHACLFLKQQGKINVVKFEKGSQNKTITSLDVSEDVIEFYGNFTNGNIGYLFVYKEVSDGHARGGAKLSSLFVTEDGGNSWNLIDIQNAPSISLQEHVIFSKMISEDIGLISGIFFAADYDFGDRTLLTTDGGRTWVNVAELPQINELQWAIVTDFTQANGDYILTIRYTASEATGEYGYAEYQLKDLNTWIRVS